MIDPLLSPSESLAGGGIGISVVELLKVHEESVGEGVVALLNWGGVFA